MQVEEWIQCNGKMLPWSQFAFDKCWQWTKCSIETFCENKLNSLGLVDNEEKPEEIEKEPEEEEKAGKIHYKMEYNFNAQELSVTVSTNDKKVWVI